MPTVLTPSGQTPPTVETGTAENKVISLGDGSDPNNPSINCSGCTININEIQPTNQPQPQPTPPKPTGRTTTLATRRSKTPPWPYGDKWPWYMGPEPANNRCEKPNPRDCIASRFRRDGPLFKTALFQNIKLIVPSNVPTFGKYPVPDSCCVERTPYCGLKNDYSLLVTTRMYNTTSMNTTDWNSTTIMPQLPVETSSNNIYTQGCYRGLGKVLSDLDWTVYFIFACAICTLDFMLLTLFGILLCCHSPKQNVSRRQVQYGRKKVPVSQRL